MRCAFMNVLSIINVSPWLPGCASSWSICAKMPIRDQPVNRLYRVLQGRRPRAHPANAPIPLDVDDPAQHLAIVGPCAALHFGKEQLKLLGARPKISLVSFVHDQRESPNPLACNKNLWDGP